jgi:hypothetical protein
VDPAAPQPRSTGGDPDTVVVVVAGEGRASTTAWCALVRSLVLDGRARVVTCDVTHLGGSAAEVVDTLARLQLVALRCGGEIRLRGAPPSLVTLLDLVGLAEALPTVDGPAPPPDG